MQNKIRQADSQSQQNVVADTNLLVYFNKSGQKLKEVFLDFSSNIYRINRI